MLACMHNDSRVICRVLIAAVNCNNLEAVRLLCTLSSNSKNSLDERDEQLGFNALHHAASVGSVPIVEYLEKHSKLSWKARTAKESWTVLHITAIHGHLDLCHYFVSQHRSSDFINARDRWGYTPLHYACDKGDTAVVCCLLDARADRSACSNDGQPLMPRSVAWITGHKDLVLVLQLNQPKPVGILHETRSMFNLAGKSSATDNDYGNTYGDNRYVTSSSSVDITTLPLPLQKSSAERSRLQRGRRNDLQMQRQMSAAAAEAGSAASIGAESFSNRLSPALSTQRPFSSGYTALNDNLSDQTIAKTLRNSENENDEDAIYEDVEPAISSPLPRTQGSSNDLNPRRVRSKAVEKSAVAMAIVPTIITSVSQRGEIEHKQLLPHNIHNPFEEFAADFDNLLERNVQQLAGCLLKNGTHHLTVKRESVVADMITAYKSNEGLCFKQVEITFSDNGGHTANRLQSESRSTSSDREKIKHETKVVLDLFWDRFLTKYFNGDCAKVPNDDIRSPDPAMWQAAGRILCHGLAMFGYVPVKLCRSSLYNIICPKSDVTVEVLINDFLLFVTQPERELLQRALAERASEVDKKSLHLLFDHYDATDVVPSDYFTGLKTQLGRMATNRLGLKSEKLTYILMRDGIPFGYRSDLAKYATLELLTHLYRKLTPKPQAVVEQFRFISAKGEVVPFSESLRERSREEKRVLYYLRQSILTMTADELATFLRAVTGVGSMPTTNHIRICFHQPATDVNANANTNIIFSRDPNNVITLPTGRYSTWKKFNENFVAAVRNDNNYRSSLVSDD